MSNIYLKVTNINRQLSKSRKICLQVCLEGVWKGAWWPSAAIVNFQFENNILFKKDIQIYFKILKHFSFQSNLQMKKEII